MNAAFSPYRTLLGTSLFWAAMAASSMAQDDFKAQNELYKSRAEVINAEAQNKQANAAIINSLANYGKAQAEAAKIGQETREKSAQNDLLETKVYYEKRAQYHTYQAAHRPKANTPEQYASRARQSGPTRLSSYQLWSKPGYLRWPTLLKSTAYDSPRVQIDELLKNRTSEDSGAGSQNCVDLQVRLDELKTELVSKVSQYKTNDYLAARKFLEAVSLEAQEPVFSVAETTEQVAGH